MTGEYVVVRASRYDKIRNITVNNPNRTSQAKQGCKKVKFIRNGQKHQSDDMNVCDVYGCLFVCMYVYMGLPS